VHRVRSDGASTTSLHSKGRESEEGLADRHIALVRVLHLHSHPAQHLDARYEGECTARAYTEFLIKGGEGGQPGVRSIKGDRFETPNRLPTPGFFGCQFLSNTILYNENIYSVVQKSEASAHFLLLSLKRLNRI